ncbi:MAG: phosphatase PAP2 family protein [Phycisphaerae bacterium]|nr:phosphatase PAP2 family protein [Phycisphaerae bacterium]
MATVRGRLVEVWRWCCGERGEVLALVAVLVVVAGAWAFLEVTGEVIEGDTQAMDERIVLAMRNADDLSDPIGPRWLEEMARDITGLGGMAVLGLMTAGVCGYLLLRRQHWAVGFVLVAVVGGVVLSLFLKSLFDRPRPEVVPHLSYVRTASFPSGHSMLSAVVYLTLGALLARMVTPWRYKLYFLAAALVTTGLVGLSRVYLGVHYPTDVLAGWSAGLVWATLCWLGLFLLQRRGKVEPPKGVTA